MPKTAIPYVDYTFSPWAGCTPVSEGCAHCFARDLDTRFYGGLHWGEGSPRRLQSESYWKDPLVWNRRAEEAGELARVLCGSMCDPCEVGAALHELRERLAELIAATPHLLWMLLSKRPEDYHLFDALTLRAENVRIGATLENQARAKERLPLLLANSARGYWASVEPMLGPVELGYDSCELDLVVCGDEDGAGRRPANLDWVRALRDECVRYEVPFFFKQWHEGGRKHDCPALDGRRWMEVPK
jgi:protein gp37